MEKKHIAKNNEYGSKSQGNRIYLLPGGACAQKKCFATNFPFS